MTFMWGPAAAKAIEENARLAAEFLPPAAVAEMSMWNEAPIYRGPVFNSDGFGPPAEGNVDPAKGLPARPGALGRLSDEALEHASLVAAGGARPFGMTQQQIDAERERRRMAGTLAEKCASGWAEMHE